MRAGDYDRVRILDYLRLCGEFAPQMLWRGWGMYPETAWKMIREFVKAGLVRRIARSRYETVAKIA